jgi:hypothetical protein
MKIIITENKRYRAITKWLDQEYGKLRKYAGNGSYRYIHYKDDDELTIFRFNRNTGVVTIINPDLERDLKSMFGLTGYEVNDIFIPWLEERYNLHVEKVQFEETTWHCNECGRYHTTRYHIDD